MYNTGYITLITKGLYTQMVNDIYRGGPHRVEENLFCDAQTKFFMIL